MRVAGTGAPRAHLVGRASPPAGAEGATMRLHPQERRMARSRTTHVTSSEETRLKAWKTKPTRSRRSSVSCASFIPDRSLPPSRTVPEVGASIHTKQIVAH